MKKIIIKKFMIGKKMYGDETGMTGHKMNKQEENDKQKDKIMLMEVYRHRYFIYIYIHYCIFALKLTG